ncbi:MAG TPA: HU family DNA-binding protein [Chitinophagaceae bacterium]
MSFQKHAKKFCLSQKQSKFVPAYNLKFHTMNKAELIAKIADDAGITKTQANTALDSFVEAVTKTLKGGGKVTLVGFGTFSVSKRAARNGRNPQTGAVIKIKAKKVARFKAGKELSGKL